ncbi:hypothetical protein Rrhod_4342 [Rhodococcus rhodnii LMG 5362]|uniref:Uncharacterized protein n=1 Tax=Rhodococcus rhodnii LMG 5362 TaxID=1273125 RepID=R7WK40_9NOCA|nr:hypothetical protein Rrhod_4342 [Rhodococcus rhodnii LMG 5362]
MFDNVESGDVAARFTDRLWLEIEETRRSIEDLEFLRQLG